MAIYSAAAARGRPTQPAQPEARKRAPAPARSARRANAATPPPRSRCWRGWSRCAAGPACISAAPTRPALHHLFAEVIDNAMDEAVAGHATFIEVALEARRLAHRHRQRPRHPGRPASEISEEIGARSHHDDAACGRQIRFRRLSDLGRPARRRRLRRQRAVGAARSRGRARPDRSIGRAFARGHPVDQARDGRQGAEPARHARALQARRADLRRGRAFQAGAPVQDGALQGLSVRRRRNPLALRAGTARPAPRYAGRGGVPLSRRPEGLSRAGHRGQGPRSSTRSSPARSRSPAATARSNGRSPGSPSTTASSIPIATRSRRPTAARTRRACAPRCCAA